MRSGHHGSGHILLCGKSPKKVTAPTMVPEPCSLCLAHSAVLKAVGREVSRFRLSTQEAGGPDRGTCRQSVVTSTQRAACRLEMIQQHTIGSRESASIFYSFSLIPGNDELMNSQAALQEHKIPAFKALSSSEFSVTHQTLFYLTQEAGCSLCKHAFLGFSI